MLSLDWKSLLSFKTLAIAYIIYVLSVFILKILFYSKRSLGLSFCLAVLLLVSFGLKSAGFETMEKIFDFLGTWGVLIVVTILNRDIRDALELMWAPSNKKSSISMGTDKTKNNIIEACIKLSSAKTGALITIEKHNTLEQYASRAIDLDAIVTIELLLQIFITDTPLHDGAVIVRGDRIVCAGAYYNLSDNEHFSKTSTGSRHRAGLGISEVTDSLTIICSEETGNISIAFQGTLIHMNNREHLQGYLDLFMR
jgi:diadenylate cyclase